MKITQSQKEFKKGERGLADVVMMEGGNVRLTMIETGNSYEMKRENLPDYFPFRAGKKIKCAVTLDGETGNVVYANPASGDKKVKFRNIGKEGEIPVAVTRHGVKGDFQAFDVFVTIVDGAWKGACGVRFLNPALFKQDENGNLQIDGYGKPLDDMKEFMIVTGLSEMEIPYSENVLPAIQKLALENDREFMASFLDGKVQSLGDYFNLEEEELTEGQKANIHPALED